MLPVCVFDSPPRPISRNMLKGDKPPFFVLNMTVEHGSTRKSMNSLISLGSSLAVFKLCGHWASVHSIYPAESTLPDLESKRVPSFRVSLPEKLIILWKMWEVKKFRLKQGAATLGDRIAINQFCSSKSTESMLISPVHVTSDKYGKLFRQQQKSQGIFRISVPETVNSAALQSFNFSKKWLATSDGSILIINFSSFSSI